MEKYTIIYQDYVGQGHYAVQYDRVETDQLEEVLKDYADLSYIFAGWPEEV